MMADTLFHPPPQSPNLSNQSQKLCYEEAIKLNIRPNTCRLADCFPGHKGCFITNVLMFGMEKLLYQISEFISLQTRFLSNKRAISYALIHVGLITAYQFDLDQKIILGPFILYPLLSSENTGEPLVLLYGSTDLY